MPSIEAHDPIIGLYKGTIYKAPRIQILRGLDSDLQRQLLNRVNSVLCYLDRFSGVKVEERSFSKETRSEGHYKAGNCRYIYRPLNKIKDYP